MNALVRTGAFEGDHAAVGGDQTGLGFGIGEPGARLRDPCHPLDTVVSVEELHERLHPIRRNANLVGIHLIPSIVVVADSEPGGDEGAGGLVVAGCVGEEGAGVGAGTGEDAGVLGLPVEDLTAAPQVHVRVERRDDRVVQRELQVVERRDVRQERHQSVRVHEDGREVLPVEADGDGEGYLRAGDPPAVGGEGGIEVASVGVELFEGVGARDA